MRILVLAVLVLSAASFTCGAATAASSSGQLRWFMARYETAPHTPIPGKAGGADVARSGCCSHHGGVAGCDAYSGYQECADGSDSPSCRCGE
jgi:hypothetical protein